MATPHYLHEMCVLGDSIELSWHCVRSRAGPGERAHLQGGESLHTCTVEAPGTSNVQATYYIMVGGSEVILFANTLCAKIVIPCALQHSISPKIAV